MGNEPYASASRVFWVVDNGSSHRGQRSMERLQAEWPRLHLVHLPVHASWLNQIEIVFSIFQRKVLTPNDFAEPDELAERLLASRLASTLGPRRSTGTSTGATSRLSSSAWTPSPKRRSSAAGHRRAYHRSAMAIPEPARATLAHRLRVRRQERWPSLVDLRIRYRGSFAYISGVTADDEPMPLFRLRYVGSSKLWGFAVYLASKDGYEDSFLPSGAFTGSPEEALDCACGLYLNDVSAWTETRGSSGPDSHTNF